MARVMQCTAPCCTYNESREQLCQARSRLTRRSASALAHGGHMWRHTRCANRAVVAQEAATQPAGAADSCSDSESTSLPRAPLLARAQASVVALAACAALLTSAGTAEAVRLWWFGLNHEYWWVGV